MMTLTGILKPYNVLVLAAVPGLFCGCTSQAKVQSQPALSNQQQQQYASIVRQTVYEQNPAAARKAITANPDDANAHKALANFYSSKGQYPAAVAQLKEVVRIRPNDRASAAVLSSFLYKTGDRKGALAEWKELAKQGDSWGQSARRHLIKLQDTVQQ